MYQPINLPNIADQIADTEAAIAELEASLQAGGDHKVQRSMRRYKRALQKRLQVLQNKQACGRDYLESLDTEFGFLP